MNVILFDFDGTIANSLEIGFQITNRLAREFGYRQINLEEFKQLQNLSSREIVKQLKISIFKIPFLARRFNVEFGRNIEQLMLIPGIKETLLELKQRGNRLAIISTNSEKNIRLVLEAHGLLDIFDQILSSSSPFGKSRLIRKMIRQNRFSPETVFYVGDETRDIEAARKSRVAAIAVTWGFNSEKILAAQNPDFLIHNPHDLLDIASKTWQPTHQKKGWCKELFSVAFSVAIVTSLCFLSLDRSPPFLIDS